MSNTSKTNIAIIVVCVFLIVCITLMISSYRREQTIIKSQIKGIELINKALSNQYEQINETRENYQDSIKVIRQTQVEYEKKISQLDSLLKLKRPQYEKDRRIINTNVDGVIDILTNY